MKITISFEAENDFFVEDFDKEIKNVMKQATEFLVDERNSEFLFDTNGNKVGFVFRSTIIRPRRRNP
jgi:hypothetical protein